MGFDLGFGIFFGILSVLLIFTAGTSVSYRGEVSWDGIIIFGLCGILFLGVSELIISRVGEGYPLTPETGRYTVLNCSHTVEYDCLLYQKDEKVKFYHFPVKMRSRTLETVPRSGAVLEVYEVSRRLHVRQIRPGRED